jgi:hypothetical protein
MGMPCQVNSILKRSAILILKSNQGFHAQRAQKPFSFVGKT